MESMRLTTDNVPHLMCDVNLCSKKVIFVVISPAGIDDPHDRQICAHIQSKLEYANEKSHTDELRQAVIPA